MCARACVKGSADECHSAVSARGEGEEGEMIEGGVKHCKSVTAT